MIFTLRSVLVGLAAWLLAFLIAGVGAINPVHLTTCNILILTISLLAGFAVVVALGSKFRLRTCDRGTAAMVFFCSWLVGVYLPIAAIWANAPFYAWALTQKATPKSDVLDPQLVSALERTAQSHYLGTVVLLLAGYIAVKYVSRTTLREDQKWRNLFAALHWVDVGFGTAAFAGGLLSMVWFESCRLTTPEEWLAYLGAAFLVCFLFRTLRLDYIALRSRLPDAIGPLVSRRTGYLGVAGLLISCAIFRLSNVFSEEGLTAQGWILILYACPFILSWAIFRRGAGNPTEANCERSRQLAQFAIRCGIWSGVAISLMISGWVMTSMVQKELRLASAGPTPFGWAVQGLKPLLCICVLPSVGAYAGSLIIAAILPQSARASERIMACAQGGAAMLVTNYVILILFALTLALLVVPCIPVKGAPKSLQLHLLLGEGKWLSLSCFYMGMLALFLAGGAAFWALEAMLDCGVMGILDRLIHRRKVRGNLGNHPVE